MEDIESNIEAVRAESDNPQAKKVHYIRNHKDHLKELIIRNLDEGINSMQEELRQLKRNEVWDLVLRRGGMNVIGTQWIYKNKSDEKGIVTKNQAKLVAQGYNQIEGVDFDENFSLVSRLKSIRLLLGVACMLKFKLF
ncbi:uncharacterized mitochondrial protein AtMg00820-like [Lathyrus oleraceus]|uniref:uncharacterized mitochondrial protein AtMg00820-like n=1 Tax=Pisum sativum TaxID=3888 RepID=UPI0021D2C1A2|nr:uncharacterized mitochondrial protein AtMg00820-like [Pisum sativum]